MGMTADHQIVARLLGQQFHIPIIAHVREQNQHIDCIAQRIGRTHRLGLRIGEAETRITGGIAGRITLIIVVGNDAHHTDLQTASFEHGVGFRLTERTGVAHHIGTQHLKLHHLIQNTPQIGLSMVKFMISKHSDIIAHAIHQINDRTPRLGHPINIGIARPAVTGIDQQHAVGRVAAGLYGSSQLGHTLNLAVHIVRREDHQGLLLGLCNT